MPAFQSVRDPCQLLRAFFPFGEAKTSLRVYRFGCSIESLLSADRYGRTDGLLVENLKRVPDLIDLCEVGVMSRFLNSAHQASINGFGWGDKVSFWCTLFGQQMHPSVALRT